MIYLKSFCIPKDTWVDFYISRPAGYVPQDLPEENYNYRMDERTVHPSLYPWYTFYNRGLERIDFDDITVFYGGNASGKTTLLNVIAQKLSLHRLSLFNMSLVFDDYCACNGGYKLADGHSSLRAIERGKIIVSDDVFKNILELRQENQKKDIQMDELANLFSTNRLERDARKQTMSNFIKRRMTLKTEESSNGEAGFQYFLNEMESNSLILLDEPENSLSAEWQSILARQLCKMVEQKQCQLVIATHSPFLLSLPNAKIYNLDAIPITTAPWYELDNMQAYYKLFIAHQREFESLI